ncbi:hypothetical protein BGZ80_008318 [Entomortierella chlamydospora]|uniref:CENP-T/Histone H4 histone fold domain-containing protein n=1 Tax=Entomortierella chlamydospora TaxID=101097 RepID=A0A9P6MYS9_9FUNG|nr:hypothetical protein BGZ79_007446 [Entomortierella chlamydospora]KAG0017394.1 hypothetical protein BGZ80_008318 [Entomortierella chlamydospora]
MESASTPRANQPRTGLRRPDYGPMQQRVLKKFPTTPHVTRRRTILDDSVLEALHQTHIGPQPASSSGSGSGSGNGGGSGDGRNESVEQVDENNPHERQFTLAANYNQNWTAQDASAIQYMPQTPQRESRTFVIAPGSGRRTPRRRSRSSMQNLRTTPLKALADANQARVNRLISEANRRGRVGRDKHSPMGIMRLLSRIPGFNPPPQSLPDRQPLPGSANWRKLTPKSSRTNHIQIPDDPANPFTVGVDNNTRHSSRLSSSRLERDPLTSAERRAYEKFRDQNPLLDPDDFNRLWEDELGMTREGGRFSFGVGESGGNYALTEDGDTRDFTVVQGDIADPFANPEGIEERPLHIGDITNTSQHGFLAENNMDDGWEDIPDDDNDPNSSTMQHQTLESAHHEDIEMGSRGEDQAMIGDDLNVREQEPADSVIPLEERAHDNELDGGDHALADDAMNEESQVTDKEDLNRGDIAIPEDGQQLDNENLGREDIAMPEDGQQSDNENINREDAAAPEDEHQLDNEDLSRGDAIVPEEDLGRGDVAAPEDEQQLDYEDGYMNINEEDHIEQQEHDEQQGRPGVHYFDDFPSELGIMSSGNVLPTSLPAPKKTVRLSAAGIPVPSMPTTLQKQLVNTFSRSRVSQEAMAVILEGSHQFFEQAANDLAAYAEHAGRKTIDESDVECLMKRLRITNEKVSVESLLQRYLPRELRDKVLYPEDMQHFRRR